MAKKGKIESNERKKRLTELYLKKRTELKKVVMDKSTSTEDRMHAVWQLDSLPKNGSKVRIRNRCALTGRPRGYFRKFRLSRVALRKLGGFGQIVGLIKASW
jgi:small subunit ribosomal protein S14